ncbi:hypothetical protein [Rubellimicrobium sp. CFH 75288]|uniref:hypothetical protein n=1 Tax=Rubellimicrobium sp. CFH 75288 TaxID=2697034 RepID=UPI001411E5AC|nr:hypothetical protein [Rubellimicrobium sp. CFH 75288]NAZ37717.1 hypothetical protein [Rubellimicrobium sp. CFH 75288]
MRALLALALLAPAPLAAQASRTFQPPQGCEAWLTIQMASCTVSHHFRCEADPEDWQRRVDMDEGGVTYYGAIDGQTQWVESFHLLSGHSERLAPDNPDPASLDELLATGLDTWDFTTLSDEIGPTRYVGQDRLTGETETIDGVTLERTEYRIVALDPEGREIWRGEGREYVSRDWRMFLSGQSTYTAGGETTQTDDRPVEFIRPGEPGFLSASPKHGCGAMMSALSPGGSHG